MSKGPNSITVQIPVFLFVEDGVHVAYTPVLELSSYGKSIQDAKEAFQEALNIFFEDTTEKGTLEKVLLQLGWRLQQRPKPNYKEPPFSKATLRKKNPVRSYSERVKIPITA